MPTAPPDVYVTVDSSSLPPKISFDPPKLIVDSGYKDVLHWKRVGSNFEFAALVFDRPNPFCGIVVTAAEITAIDTHPSSGDEHPYSILICIGSYYFRSEVTLLGAGPIIHNN